MGGSHDLPSEHRKAPHSMQTVVYPSCVLVLRCGHEAVSARAASISVMH
jgi:hypothetical protein